jgi:hypothetical protein
VQHDNHWWSPSGTATYAKAAFFQPTGFSDPFGNAATVVYEPFLLQPATVTNALHQSLVVVYD